MATKNIKYIILIMKNTMKNTMKILKFFVDQISFGVSGQPLAFLFQLIRIRDTFTYKWVNTQVMWLLALLILLHNILYIGVSGLDLSNYISSAFSISTIVVMYQILKIKIKRMKMKQLLRTQSLLNL